MLAYPCTAANNEKLSSLELLQLPASNLCLSGHAHPSLQHVAVGPSELFGAVGQLGGRGLGALHHLTCDVIQLRGRPAQVRLQLTGGGQVTWGSSHWR